MERVTKRVLDITGAENTMLLLPAPGDEVAVCGGLIAEACARGRPPFVVILGDGAPDGSAATARQRERASRAAAALLGVPDGRLLFVGLRQGAFPGADDPVARALVAAMAQVSWRQDCNVIAAPVRDAATWRLARDVAARERLALIGCDPPVSMDGVVWRLDVAAWCPVMARAGALHDLVPAATSEAYVRAV